MLGSDIPFRRFSICTPEKETMISAASTPPRLRRARTSSTPPPSPITASSPCMSGYLWKRSHSGLLYRKRFFVIDDSGGLAYRRSKDASNWTNCGQVVGIRVPDPDLPEMSIRTDTRHIELRSDITSGTCVYRSLSSYILRPTHVSPEHSLPPSPATSSYSTPSPARVTGWSGSRR